MNSYHDWGCTSVPSGLETWATADDGVVKAVRWPGLPVVGIMWHPERILPYRAQDVSLIRQHLEGENP